MNEDMSYQSILQRMLDGVPAGFDKREGSVIWDALAPAALELARVCGRIDMFIDECFADTASREFLIRRAGERGLTPYPAAAAVRVGEFTPETAEIPIGTRFSLGVLNYAVTEKIADVPVKKYKLVCETPGNAGNRDSGVLIPVDYTDGLTSAVLSPEILVPGEDEEDTERFRKRYFDSLETQSFGGNVRDYTDKALRIAGVGGVKVLPAWNGGGTVKLIIIGGDCKTPSAVLINSVQSVFDEIAPIGHIVTVEGVRSLTVNVSFSMMLQNGWNYGAAEQSVKAAVSEYFGELAKEWDKSSSLTVRISQLESGLLDLPGVIDISGTKLNGAAQNLIMPSNSIPTVGEVKNVN